MCHINGKCIFDPLPQDFAAENGECRNQCGTPRDAILHVSDATVFHRYEYRQFDSVCVIRNVPHS